jgi:hypothetical protein
MRFRSLAATNPELIGQWHSTKNGQATPDKVTAGSKKVVWWRCSNGHEWQAPIATRHRGSPCPRCSAGRISIPEQFLFEEIRKAFPNAINQIHMELQGKVAELDIFVPDIRLAVEYDGTHHATKHSKDEDKNRLLKKSSIQLIRVRCVGLPHIEPHGSVEIEHSPAEPASLGSCLHFIGEWILSHYEVTENQRLIIDGWSPSTTTPTAD